MEFLKTYAMVLGAVVLGAGMGYGYVAVVDNAACKRRAKNLSDDLIRRHKQTQSNTAV